MKESERYFEEHIVAFLMDQIREAARIAYLQSIETGRSYVSVSYAGNRVTITTSAPNGNFTLAFGESDTPVSPAKRREELVERKPEPSGE